MLEYVLECVRAIRPTYDATVRANCNWLLQPIGTCCSDDSKVYSTVAATIAPCPMGLVCL